MRCCPCLETVAVQLLHRVVQFGGQLNAGGAAADDGDVDPLGPGCAENFRNRLSISLWKRRA